jgi:peptidoglycan/xylan/chitin deacetylase (PgdA/CDA1 family)
MPGRALLLSSLVTAALLTGCAASQAEPGARHPVASAPESSSPSPSASSATPTASAPPPAADVAANELGRVPVLMYHQLKDRPKGVYDVTPAHFRAELERLAREGYVPVTASAYATGRIDIPAGKHPVVLTFDDSTRSQLALDAAGDPRPGTAVAILLEVAARHPGFTPTATFFVNEAPFAEPGGRRYLGWLHDHGFEVGNHTRDHLPMRGLSAEQVRRQIAANAAMITRAVPGVEVSTLALPLGSRPRNHRLMMSGQWHGTSYRHAAAFLVGSGSASSPFARSYDPTGVPRMRSQGRRGPEAHYASSQTLDRLAASPLTRYTSDGDPAVVSFPKALAAELARGERSRARPY